MEITRPDRGEAERKLASAGYERLGSGAFGSVFSKSDSPTVLKLFDAKDSAYMGFVDLVLANPNPHFPKFQGKYLRITDGYYAVRMERLQPNTNVHWPIKFQQYAKVYADYPEKLTQEYAEANPKSAFLDELWDTLDYFEEHPELKIAIELVVDNLYPKYKLDFVGNDNFMIRSKQWVIVDPVAPNL